MTRWLQAAQGASVARTEPTEPTEPARELCDGGGGTTDRGVSSVSSVLSEGGRGAPGGQPAPDPEAPDGDARAYLRHLLDNGPATVGAVGSALGWGATRAWQAEARLRAAGLVAMGPLGRAHPVKGGRP